MRGALRQHEKIKYWLRLKGISLAQIARELNVTPTTVTTVSQGTSRSRRIEAAIAGHLGMGPSRLWPDRYMQAEKMSNRGEAPREGWQPSTATG